MRYFENLDESFGFFKAMASHSRIQILKILLHEREMNLGELAERLDITSGALTSHIRVLEENGIIETKSSAGKHGIQKVCSIVPEKYLFFLGASDYARSAYHVELSPGHYVDYQATPTCGLATSQKIIGVYDDPVYFADVEHFNAEILWFTTGYVEYILPNYIPENGQCKEISIQAELGSEAVGFNNDYRSDIYFFINGQQVAIWQSPGDLGDVKGIYNPEWWAPSMNQYGTMLEMIINSEGTFIAGQQVSAVTVDSLDIKPKDRIRLRMEVPENSPYPNGLTIFGRGFGNFNGGINVSFRY